MKLKKKLLISSLTLSTSAIAIVPTLTNIISNSNIQLTNSDLSVDLLSNNEYDVDSTFVSDVKSYQEKFNRLGSDKTTSWIKFNQELAASMGQMNDDARIFQFRKDFNGKRKRYKNGIVRYDYVKHYHGLNCYHGYCTKQYDSVPVYGTIEYWVDDSWSTKQNTFVEWTIDFSDNSIDLIGDSGYFIGDKWEFYDNIKYDLKYKETIDDRYYSAIDIEYKINSDEFKKTFNSRWVDDTFYKTESFYNIKKLDSVYVETNHLGKGDWIQNETKVHNDGTYNGNITGQLFVNKNNFRINSNNSDITSLTGFIDSINLDKLLEIKTDLKTNYSKTDNGNIYKEAPKIKIGLNDEFVKPIMELYKLFELYQEILTYKSKDTTNAIEKPYLDILLANISSLSETSTTIRKSFENIKNETGIRPIRNEKMNEMFVKFKNLGGLIPMGQNNTPTVKWKDQYLILMQSLKNSQIVVDYKTKATGETIKSTPIWDGANWNYIEAINNQFTNSNYIELLNFRLEKSQKNKVGSENYKANALKVDLSNKEGLSKTTNGIKYDFYYRSNSKDANVSMDSKSQGQYGITSKKDEYNTLGLADFVNSDNSIKNDGVANINIVNIFKDAFSGISDLVGKNVEGLSGAVVKKYLGKFKDDNEYTDGTYQIGMNNALNKFGLTADSEGNINYKQDDATGEFYAILDINNWMFNDETVKDKFQGFFNQQNKRQFLSNKNIALIGVEQDISEDFYNAKLLVKFESPLKVNIPDLGFDIFDSVVFDK